LGFGGIVKKKRKLYEVVVRVEVSLTFDRFRAFSKKEALDIIINRGAKHPDHEDHIDYSDMIMYRFIKSRCRAREIKDDDEEGCYRND